EQTCLQPLERPSVAKEKRFIRRHGIDDLVQHRFVPCPPDFLDELADAVDATPPCDWRQAALNQIALLRRQHEAGALIEHLLQIVELGGIHFPSPPAIRMIAGPICCSGRISLHRPACATAPGIPQTTLVSRSCASTCPPACTTASHPFNPSDPIPVRMIVRSRSPTLRARLLSIGSTAGLHEFSAGPSSSRMMMPPATARSTTRCFPPGAI